MAKPYDNALKPVLEMDPDAFVGFLRRFLPVPEGRAETIDTELATIAPQADKLFRIGGRTLLDLEAQSTRDPLTLRRLRLYNVAAEWKFGLHCDSVLLLLRRDADGPEYTGAHRSERPDGITRIDFSYAVLRLWQLPAEPLLADPRLATLAPLTDAAGADLAGTVRQAAARIERDGGAQALELLAAMRILLGLRYNRAAAAAAFQGVRGMRESSVYQEILEEGEAKGRVEGRADEARRLLLKVGQHLLGPAPEWCANRLAALADADQLESLFDRLLAIRTWDELFA